MSLPRDYEPLTGQRLKAARRAFGISQTEMGKQIGFGRHAVSYWETKATISSRQARWGIPSLLCEVLGLRVLPDYPTTTRARGDGVLSFADYQQEALDRAVDKELTRIAVREAERNARRRVNCGAKTRKGHACKKLSEPGRRRCKFHGGKSSGPKTDSGKEIIRQAQLKRWAKWREKINAEPKVNPKVKATSDLDFAQRLKEHS